MKLLTERKNKQQIEPIYPLQDVVNFNTVKMTKKIKFLNTLSKPAVICESEM